MCMPRLNRNRSRLGWYGKMDQLGHLGPREYMPTGKRGGGETIGWVEVGLMNGKNRLASSKGREVRRKRRVGGTRSGPRIIWARCEEEKTGLTEK